MRFAASLMLLIATTAAVIVPSKRASASPTSFVNPLIGTTNEAGTYPGATMPYGMLQWSPRTAPMGSTGDYEYQDSKITGFPLTHLSGTGCGGGSGDVPILPYTGKVSMSPELDRLYDTYADTFKHRNEQAQPGYYRVKLGSGITVELTATARTGFGRFTFPSSDDPTVLVRASDSQGGSTDSSVVIDQRTNSVRGWVSSGAFCRIHVIPYYKLFFVIHFDSSIKSYGTWHNGTLSPAALRSGGAGDAYSIYADGAVTLTAHGSGVWATFARRSQNVVKLRVGISYVSLAGAEANLRAENPVDTTFGTIRKRARDAWDSKLSAIRIVG